MRVDYVDSLERIERFKNKTLLSNDRLVVIHTLLAERRFIKGLRAEVGVFDGGVTGLIASMSDDVVLAFDSFSGLPKSTAKDNYHKEGEFKSKGGEKYLRKIDNVEVRKGFFPETLLPSDFASQYVFVHLDVDLYESTRAGLEFFFPRLHKNGVLVIDDFGTIFCGGVTTAVQDFCSANNVEIFQHTFSQAVLYPKK